HWGGRGVKGEAWRALLAEDFVPRLERMWQEATGSPPPLAHEIRPDAEPAENGRQTGQGQTGLARQAAEHQAGERAARGPYLHPRALLGFFPCYALGNEIVVLDPDDRARELTRFVCPRQPGGERICLADFFRPAHDGGPPAELDVVALQAVTVGSEVTELMAALERDGEFSEQLFVHGLGVQCAEALAEWLHASARAMLGIPRSQGRRYSWGYPAVPEQAEHVKVDRLLDLSRIGMRITDGYAPDPEQSTLAMIAHHPQAIYFGTRQGRLPRDPAPDDLIKGSPRDPSLFGAGGEPPELGDSEPQADAPDAEEEPLLTS
ncbi:MAG: hypothetical protein KGJ43_09610, partial [Acidobacteriota bacterium]|nr:hypothetical protein [Acidobacteriota bacterium]